MRQSPVSARGRSARLPATLRVHRGTGGYPVWIGGDLLDRAGAILRARPFGRPVRQIAVITDDRVGPLYAERVLASLRAADFAPVLVTVPAGEKSKSLAEVARVTDALIAGGLDRHGLIVALGGGVVGDLAGFVASIYYRGIPWVQLPTTVVAQVDSAIGGKTGVNSGLGKNLLGSFHRPAAVLADVAVLDTLSARDYQEGFAEAIKHGVIRDRGLLTALATLVRGDRAAMVEIVRRNLAIKAALVEQDEFERKGLRAVLNFGHTIGHGIEQAAGYGRLLHGEAVSLGMVAAGRLSMEKAGLPTVDYDEMLARLRQFGLPTVLPPEVAKSAILDSLARDKKFSAGQIKFVLTAELGTAFVSAPGQVTLADLERAIDGLRR